VERSETPGRQQKPRKAAERRQIAHNRAMVMPLRGMRRVILTPGVSLRSTPGYPHLAALRHRQRQHPIE